MAAFSEGLFEMVPKEQLEVFDSSELEVRFFSWQLLIGGIAEIDVDDWKSNSEYRTYKDSDEVIVWFWQVTFY